MSKNKKMIAAVVAIVVVIALFLGIYAATRPAASAGSKTITVEVIHSDESSKTFTFTSDAENLAEVLEKEDLVVSEDGPYGMYIVEVDGERAVYEEDGAYWCLYIGDEYATTGANDTLISDGDLYKLVYTIG